VPQTGPGGPRNGSEPPPPSWQPRQPQYQPAGHQPAGHQPAGHQPAGRQPPDYPPPDYQQPQYPPQQGQYPPQPAFRNPRTGSDYRRGDDYTIPSGQGPYAPPDPYASYYQDAPYYQEQPGPYADEPYSMPEPSSGGPGKPGRRAKQGRFRRFFRRPTVRVICGVLLIFFAWVAFSLGQALTANNGLSTSEKLAEWGRDHYLGPVVTMLEQWTYTPPKVGGKPSFSLSDPQGKLKFKKVHGFKPDIPKSLTPFASPALAGEGVWTLRETVNGQPALFTTEMRIDAIHTSYVAGIASFDQRLVKFELRPGSQDPGAGFGGAQDWIVPGTRTGLLATFNGGFRLYASRGGFYLNGRTSGTLTNGAASVVYYRNGTIKIGDWGRDVSMTADVVGVRQNLKLIVDHGKVVSDINQNVEANFGATIGGAAGVWRSGIGETKDGRIVYVYGPGMSAADVAGMLQRAGAVEGMELDINPDWTEFEYYKADGHPSDPNPVPMLPDQPRSPYRYYSVWARDFTAVYAK
jgi:hypothetical protein